MGGTNGLDVTRDAGVVLLRLDRPERRNAIDTPLFTALRDELRRIAASAEDRVVVITGAGGAFSAGGDLNPSTPAAQADDATDPGRTTDLLRDPIGAAAQALHDLPQPTIAAVEGVAVGAGANLAFGCDLVVAAATARFAEVFVRRGLSLDFGGSWLLPRLVGLQRAKLLALTGDWVDAERAAGLGLVAEVVPDGEALARALALAHRLSVQSPTAMAHVKRNLDAAFGRTMAEALEAEAVSQAACSASPEFQAQLAAFRAGAERRTT